MGVSSLSPFEPLIERIESTPALDDPAQKIAAQVRSTIPAGTVKDALSGSWLGHALHPLLTDLVIGSILSATVLDVVGGRESAKASGGSPSGSRAMRRPRSPASATGPTPSPGTTACVARASSTPLRTAPP